MNDALPPFDVDTKKKEKTVSSRPHELAIVQDSGQLSAEGKEKSNRANYEVAITACGYGKFHYLLLLALIPTNTALVYSTATLSYVIPTAECDLKLTNNDKGAINAAVFIGLTVGAFFGGFASDIFGRRKLILLGSLSEFCFNSIATFAHQFWLLFLMKICAGFSLTGPVASVYSYAAETHCNEKRARVIMINGAILALAQASQPALAYFIIPMTFRIQLISGVLDFTSWRLFLLLCTLPSLLAGTAFFFFPESPKFLMSKGRTEEALESFKRIYVTNTGKPAHTYPIYELEVPAKQVPTTGAVGPSGKGALTVISNGWKQVRPIFRPPFINIAMLVFFISACTFIAMNTMGLWVPQMFASINEARRLNATATTICGLIGTVVQGSPSTSELPEEEHFCTPVSGDVYLRSFIISATAAFSYLFTTPFIGCIGKRTFASIFRFMKAPPLLVFTENKRLLDVVIYIYEVCFPVLAATAISINWATNSDVFMALLALYTVLIRNCLSVMSTISVDLFPTAFRSVAVSLTLMFGRMASVLGNLLFPVLLDISCGVVFFTIGGILMG